MNTELTLWDPNTLPANFTLVLHGRRRTGKSFLIKHLCHAYLKRKFEYVYVFSETAFNGWFQTFCPPQFIYEKFDDDILQAIINRQKVLHQLTKGSNENINCLIILDDVLDVKNSPSLEKLFLQARHYKISLIMAIQDATLISKKMRTNIDTAITFREPMEDRREMFIQSFLGFKDIKKGEALMNQAHNKADHSVLVIDCTTHSYNPADYVYYYEAQPTPKTFKMGSLKQYAVSLY